MMQQFCGIFVSMQALHVHAPTPIMQVQRHLRCGDFAQATAQVQEVFLAYPKNGPLRECQQVMSPCGFCGWLQCSDAPRRYLAFGHRLLLVLTLLCVQILANAQPKYEALTAAAAKSLETGPYPNVIDNVQAAAQLCR